MHDEVESSGMEVDENGRLIIVPRPVTAESQAKAAEHLAVMERYIAEYTAAGKRVPTDWFHRRDRLRAYSALPRS